MGAVNRVENGWILARPKVYIALGSMGHPFELLFKANQNRGVTFHPVWIAHNILDPSKPNLVWYTYTKKDNFRDFLKKSKELTDWTYKENVASNPPTQTHHGLEAWGWKRDPSFTPRVSTLTWEYTLVTLQWCRCWGETGWKLLSFDVQLRWTTRREATLGVFFFFTPFAKSSLRVPNPTFFDVFFFIVNLCTKQRYNARTPCRVASSLVF